MDKIQVPAHTRSTNPHGKTRPLDNPYTVYKRGYWEWRVLKAYQSPEKEATNPYARWFCAVKSPYTFGSWEYGDTYVSDIPGAERGSREGWSDA